MPPDVKRGDEIIVGEKRAIIYAKLYDGTEDPGPAGYRIGVVYLEGSSGMANMAYWSEPDQCWQFVKDEVPQVARPGLDKLVEKLRFRVVK